MCALAFDLLWMGDFMFRTWFCLHFAWKSVIVSVDKWVLNYIPLLQYSNGQIEHTRVHTHTYKRKAHTREQRQRKPLTSALKIRQLNKNFTAREKVCIFQDYC